MEPVSGRACLLMPCRLTSKFGVFVVLFLSLLCGFYVLFMMGYVSTVSMPAGRFSIHYLPVVKDILEYRVFRGVDSRTNETADGELKPLLSVANRTHSLKIENNKTTPSKATPNVTAKPVLKSPPKKPLVRPETCTDCNLHTFKMLINEPNICVKGDVDLLLVILTAFPQRAKRDTIRQTWASLSKNNTGNVRHVFLFGSGKAGDNQMVRQESSSFHDILQEDFVDSYGNLTYKTNMGLKWATKYCGKARYILKIDDDMWANTPKILAKINSGEMDKLVKDRAYGGMCVGPGGPIRDKRSKWYASVNSYPSKIYPRFCTGPGYIISSKVAKDVVNISKNVPFFHLEDIFIAICIKKLGYSAQSIQGFYNHKVPFNACKYKKDILTSHQVTPNELKSVWSSPCS